MLFKVKNHGNTGGVAPTIHPTAFVAPNAIISIFGKDLALTTRQVRKGT